MLGVKDQIKFFILGTPLRFLHLGSH